MKNRIVTITITIFLIFIISFSCSTEVDINGSYKDYPVAYCILDQSQEYQYVKVNKLFLGESSAYEIAKESDSLFYDNVKVTLKQLNNNTVVGIWNFDAVDMPKDDGPFATDKNIIYQQKIPFKDINTNTKFRLEIDIENGKYNLSKDVSILDKPKVTKPANRTMSIANPDNSYEYRYFPVNKGYVYGTTIVFNYLEVTGTDTVYKSIEWKRPQRISTSSGAVYNEEKESFSNASFYAMIQSKMGTVGENVERLVKMPESLTFKVVCADEDYYTYMQVSLPSSGIAQHKPDFSNVEGGYGLIASRATSEISYGTFNGLTLKYLHDVFGFAPTTNEYYKPYLEF